VGSRLLEELERLARAEGVHRLELTVLEDNERAVALYRRLGFEAEGRRRDSLKVEGRYVDELSLAKLL
jgi:RimJ/RimL family protein N-acetyltransferase